MRCVLNWSGLGLTYRITDGARMKGKISKRLESVLGDANASRQLSEHLIRGTDGSVTVGQKTFKVHVDVRTGQMSTWKNKLAKAS